MIRKLALTAFLAALCCCNFLSLADEPNEPATDGTEHLAYMRLLIPQTSAADALLTELRDHLPQGWRGYAMGDTLMLTTGEKTWTLPAIGRPARSEDQSEEDYFREHGVQSVLRVQLRLGPALSEEDYRTRRLKRLAVIISYTKGYVSKQELVEQRRKLDELPLPEYRVETHAIYVDHPEVGELHPAIAYDRIMELKGKLNEQLDRYAEAPAYNFSPEFLREQAGLAVER